MKIPMGVTKYYLRFFFIFCCCFWRVLNDFIHYSRIANKLNNVIARASAISGYMNLTGMSERHVVEVDGTVSPYSCRVGCGGVLKAGGNSLTECFLLCLEDGDYITAKLWGCLMGLKRAWDQGAKNVILRSDSEYTVHLILNEVFETHDGRPVLSEINNMIQRNWRVQFEVIDSDDNLMAYSLAKIALNEGFGFQIFGPEAVMTFLNSATS